MDAWYKVVTQCQEVREGRSFNPDEFAIALEQVVAGRGPDDYRDPAKLFARTYFTKALREHAGMVLQRLAGRTANVLSALYPKGSEEKRLVNAMLLAVPR